MKYNKFVKILLLFILLGMALSLIINYYNNVLESENIVINEDESTESLKSKYETSIANPEYFFRNNNNREIFFKARSANKINSLLNLKSISGNIKLNKNTSFNFFADNAILKINKKEVFLDGNIKASSNDILDISSSKMLIDYNNYTVSSDQIITLNYNNIKLKASKFHFNNNQVLNFVDGVKVKIKKSSK